MRLKHSETQLLLDALECLIRVHLGQASRVFDLPLWAGLRDDYTEAHREAGFGYAKRLEEILGQPGIRSDLVSNTARQAYRLKARLEGNTLREGLFDEYGRVTEAAKWVEDSLYPPTDE